MKYLIFMLLIPLLSCINSGNINKKTTNDTSASIKNQIINKNEIQGGWAEKENENDIFDIVGDSIYFVEHPHQYYFKIIDDTFIIFYEDTFEKYKILKLDNDSFIYKSRLNYINRLFKRKE